MIIALVRRLPILYMNAETCITGGIMYSLIETWKH